MQQRPLGDMTVSAVCLGTMTYGKDTPEPEAFAQMDRALAAGISFFDTAEMYPVNPARAETYGVSEQVIGAWLSSRRAQGRVQIATKVSGPNGGHTRQGRGFEPDMLADAVDGSLSRLGVEVIDLYQFHWPKRGTYAFRNNWSFDPRGSSRARVQDHIGAMVEAMAAIVAAGKVRSFGLSNETAWGTMSWLAAADAGRGPRVVSVQNEYSALCRIYDTDMAELGQKENVTLLAFSPLAAGLLSGKYHGGQVPPGSRVAVDRDFGGKGDLGGRRTPQAVAAADDWVALARDMGLDPVHMAIAFVRQRPFPVIPIIGATHTGQLDHLIAGMDLVLDDEALERITAFHRLHPMPY